MSGPPTPVPTPAPFQLEHGLASATLDSPIMSVTSEHSTNQSVSQVFEDRFHLDELMVFNYTPHQIKLIDKNTGQVMQVFDPAPGTFLRGKQITGEIEDYLFGIPIIGRGEYQTVPEEEALFGNEIPHGSIVLASAISCENYRECALRNNVTMLIPGSGPGQCLRKGNEIVGSYVLLKPF